MRKIEIALAVAFGLVCWGQSSFAADDSDSAPSTAVPSPTTNGTGGGWQGKGHMRGAGKGGGAQGLGKGGGGGGGGHGAFAKQVLGLQSLTPDQRTKIRSILADLKQEAQAMKAANEAGNAGGAASTASAGAGAGAGAGGESKGQFRAKRRAAMQQIRALLTESQLKELDSQNTAGQLVAPKGGAAASGDGS